MTQRLDIDRVALGICWIPAAIIFLFWSNLLPGEVNLSVAHFIAIAVISVLIAMTLITLTVRRKINRKPLFVGAVIATIPALFWIYAIGYVAIFGLGH
jgi:hypothetical protein